MTMGTSKPLPRTLRTKVIDVHKAGEGYKKIAKCLQVAGSSVCNVIMKLQMKSERPRKLSERTACRIAVCRDFKR